MSLRLSNPMSAVVWLAFFVPAALFGVGLDRACGVAVFLLGAAVLVSKPSPWEARKPSAQALKLFLVLELLYAVSAVYSAAFNGIQSGVWDYLELLRYVLCGTFVVYVIRHYDIQVGRAMDWAMTGALYLALLYPPADPRGYVAVMTLCFLLFFSRLRLRFLHAAAALLVVLLSADRASWKAAFLVLSAALALLFYRGLVRRRVKLTLGPSLVFFAALLAGMLLYLRSNPVAVPAPIAAPDTATLQFIRRSPFFGWGPVDGEAIPGRSQFLFWTLKGGLLSAGLILTGLALAGYRLLRAASGSSKRLVGAAAFLGSVALMLASGRYLESFRLFFLTSFFMAAMQETRR
jgi:hypothetical protein